jgi:hypothetical protein
MALTVKVVPLIDPVKTGVGVVLLLDKVYVPPSLTLPPAPVVKPTILVPDVMPVPDSV